MSMVLGSFVSANKELIKILRRRENPPPQPHTPPNRTTVPANPNYSGGSTDSASSGSSSDSWSSADSRPEHFTHQFVYQFINASQQAVEAQLGRIPWLIESCNELICRSARLSLNAKFSTHQYMKIKLGSERINVIDDGGLVLSSSKVDKHKIPPVLSIEVSPNMS